MKLSFKKQPKETGLSSVARPWADVDIKGDGFKVGSISAKNAFQDQYEIWFCIKNEPTESNPCFFNNVRIKFKCDTEDEARAFVKDKWAAILSHYDLYQMKD